MFIWRANIRRSIVYTNFFVYRSNIDSFFFLLHHNKVAGLSLFDCQSYAEHAHTPIFRYNESVFSFSQRKIGIFILFQLVFFIQQLLLLLQFDCQAINIFFCKLNIILFPFSLVNESEVERREKKHIIRSKKS